MHIETLPTEAPADALVLLIDRNGATTAPYQSVDERSGGHLSDLRRRSDLPTAAGATLVLFPTGLMSPRLIVASLGDDAGPAGIRRAAAEAARRARDLGARTLTVALPPGDGAAVAAAVVEGVRLGLHRPRGETGLERLNLWGEEGAAAGAARGDAIAEGVLLARRLVDLPPNVATPRHLAERARDIARRRGLRVEIGDRAWIMQERMGALAAVAQGAGHEPQFIILEHDPTGAQEPPLVLVGKGVTFDSGGISIKERRGMEAMKSDMAGAAAVLGAMDALAALRVPRRVIALVPTTENVLDAHAYRPSDVITTAAGLTVEIISTDAEGRLLLADALHYAKRFAPTAVVDLATLTGACVVALGRGTAAGLFGNDASLQQRIERAAHASGERVWPLPVWEDYLREIRSDVADLKNSSGTPHGGACIAAAFLQAFVAYPWAHLDIAGMALAERQAGEITRGGTGYGVRLLIEWVFGEGNTTSRTIE